jgi:TP901 family phage tail tape measure protein
MAEKKLMVVIGAKAGEFNKVMGQVQRDTRQISKAFKDVGRDLQTAGKGMTAAFTVPILAVGGAAVKAYGDFEQTMTQSTAIMGDLSDDMRKQMETAAREIGKTTKFGATEAAEAFEFLALAGLSAEQSIAALPQVAAFAQAGNFDLARATDLATDAQAALGMSSKNAQQNLTNLTRVTDVLTRAATLANANTEQFSESLTEKAGTALRNLKKDVEEGAAVLAVFADQGVKGGQAGTTLNATLEGLSRQAIINKDVFAAHNVEVFDGNGQMKNMADITADLEKALGGMSTEEQRATLMKMGFNRQALNGIQMLMGNSEAIREYENELRIAGGTTQDVAEKQMDNLWDQLGLIKDQLIDVAIELGQHIVPILKESVIPMFEKFVEWVGKLAKWFGDLSPTWQKIILIALGFLAAVGPLLIVVGKIVFSIGQLIPIFAKMGAIFKLVGGIFSGVALGPVAIIIAAIAALAVIVFLVIKYWEPIKEFFSNLWEGIKKVFSAVWEWIKDLFLKYHPVGILITHWEEIKEFFAGLWDTVKELAAAAWEWIKDLFLQYHPVGLVISHWDTIKEFFSNLWDRVKQIFSGALDTVKQFVIDRFNSVVSFLTGIRDRIVGVFQAVRDRILSIWQGIVSGIKGFVNRIIDAINSMIRGMNRLKWDVPSWVPLIGGKKFGISIPIIPRLHSGTDYFMPPGGAREGLALLERGEKVVPRSGTAKDREVRHSGTITVRGVSDQGQLVGVVDAVIERLIAEVRA